MIEVVTPKSRGYCNTSLTEQKLSLEFSGEECPYAGQAWPFLQLDGKIQFESSEGVWYVSYKMEELQKAATGNLNTVEAVELL